jgi:hypothetical protein
MSNLWPPEYLNPIIEDLTGFEECRGFRGFSINVEKKQIINTRTRRLNHSRDPWSGRSDIEFTTLEQDGDYFVNVPKHRIDGINHNAQILYSEIEKIHMNHL